VVLKGKILVHARTGDEIVVAGQVFYMPPGHAPEFPEDCELFEFAPIAEFKEMMDHVMRQTPGGR
jgi:quercetin dioxygenase-like cupin family protein